jgi:hypothetical protein
MRTEKSNLGMYVKLFEHKFKAKYNRAKAKRIERKINNLETDESQFLDGYAEHEPFKTTGYLYQ